MSKIASLSITNVSGNTFKWEIKDLSNLFNTSFYHEAGISDSSVGTKVADIGTKISKRSASAPTTSDEKEVSGTFTISKYGTHTFYGYVRVSAPAKANYYYFSAGSATVTHVDPNPNPRPSDFSWTLAKVSGGDFIVTEGEWTAFQNKINQFRKYKGLSNYGFTSVSSGQDFQAYLFRQAANAIYEISSSLGVASACRNVQSGDAIYGWYFTNLSTALNNVT